MARPKKQKEAPVAFTLPSDPAARKKIKELVEEVAGINQTIKDYNESKKGLIETLNTDYQVPKKAVGKLAKMVSEHNFEEVAEEFSAIEDIYEVIFNGKADSAPSTSDED